MDTDDVWVSLSQVPSTAGGADVIPLAGYEMANNDEVMVEV